MLTLASPSYIMTICVCNVLNICLSGMLCAICEESITNVIHSLKVLEPSLKLPSFTIPFITEDVSEICFDIVSAINTFFVRMCKGSAFSNANPNWDEKNCNRMKKNFFWNNCLFVVGLSLQ